MEEMLSQSKFILIIP